MSEEAPSSASTVPKVSVKPWLFVPLLYFMQAIPVTVVQELATIFYKDLGIENASITQWTSLIALPWSLQFLLGPLVDLNGRKRDWILGGQLIIAIGLGLSAFLLNVPFAFQLTLLTLGATAIVSALCNIATDGFYILALDKREQARFVGVQTTCYRLGRLFCIGILVWIVGYLTGIPRIEVALPSGSYLQLSDGKRQVVVSAARLGVNSSAGGELTDDRGRAIEPKIFIPAGTTRFSIDARGQVIAADQVVGKIKILQSASPGDVELDRVTSPLLLDGGAASKTTQAIVPIVVGWLIVLAGCSALYGLGYLAARNLTPDTDADKPAVESGPGELGLNVRRTITVVALGLSGYFFLNAFVRLTAHALWAALGSDPDGRWKGWMLPAKNLVFNMDLGLGGVGTEAAQFAVCGGLAVLAWVLARNSIKGTSMGEAFLSFVRQQGFWAIFGFILFYRFGEAMVSKMSPLFLKDAVESGGLAVANDRLGLIKGVFGVLGIVLGGICGGVFVSKLGLRKAFWPMAILMHLPNLLYLWASIARPASNSPALYVVDFVDQFGYGFGYAGYSVYLMWVAQRGGFKTAHYAIGTGMGALCIAIAGILSGILQSNFGYSAFFVWVMVLTIPGMLMLRFIPLDDQGLPS